MCPVPVGSNADAAPTHANHDRAAAPALQAQPRLEQLFRYALRHAQINPLLYAVLRYRNGEEGRA